MTFDTIREKYTKAIAERGEQVRRNRARVQSADEQLPANAAAQARLTPVSSEEDERLARERAAVRDADRIEFRDHQAALADLLSRAMNEAVAADGEVTSSIEAADLERAIVAAQRAEAARLVVRKVEEVSADGRSSRPLIGG